MRLFDRCHSCQRRRTPHAASSQKHTKRARGTGDAVETERELCPVSNKAGECPVQAVQKRTMVVARKIEGNEHFAAKDFVKAAESYRAGLELVRKMPSWRDDAKMSQQALAMRSNLSKTLFRSSQLSAAVREARTAAHHSTGAEGSLFELATDEMRAKAHLQLARCLQGTGAPKQQVVDAVECGLRQAELSELVELRLSLFERRPVGEAVIESSAPQAAAGRSTASAVPAKSTPAKAAKKESHLLSALSGSNDGRGIRERKAPALIEGETPEFIMSEMRRRQILKDKCMEAVKEGCPEVSEAERKRSEDRRMEQRKKEAEWDEERRLAQAAREIEGESGREKEGESEEEEEQDEGAESDDQSTTDVAAAEGFLVVDSVAVAESSAEGAAKIVDLGYEEDGKAEVKKSVSRKAAGVGRSKPKANGKPGASKFDTIGVNKNITASQGYQVYTYEQQKNLKLKDGHRVMARPKNIKLPKSFKQKVGVINHEQLGQYCAAKHSEKRLLLSLYGDIFDVSDRPDKYGQGSPYEELCGKDITWGMVTGDDSPEKCNLFYDLFKIPEPTKDILGLSGWLFHYNREYGAPVGRLEEWETEWRLAEPPVVTTPDCCIM